MIGQWIDFFFTRIGSVFTYLNTIYILPNVSLLHLLIFFAIAIMVTNVFVGRGQQ